MTHPTSPTHPDEAQINWFGHSNRIVSGAPDTRYGWWNTPDGPCIVKALNLTDAGYGATLLDNENTVLARLGRSTGTLVPVRVPHPRRDWLVTHFGGLSVQALARQDAAGVNFPLAERLAVWIHYLERARELVEQGALPVDLWGANLVVPFTQATQGQLRLHEVIHIDHAHTVMVGMNLRRPVWLRHDMPRIAPELRDCLHGDQQRLRDFFAGHDAVIPGLPARDEAQALRSRRLWLDYSAPQAVQQQLDADALRPAEVIQYAVGVALRPVLNAAPAPLRSRLEAVQQRMTQANPRQRHARLADAADALRAVLPSVPMVGQHHFAPVQPADLCIDEPSRHETRVQVDAAPPPPPTSPTRHPAPGTRRPAKTAHPTAGRWAAAPSGASLAAATGAGAAAGWLIPWRELLNLLGG